MNSALGENLKKPSSSAISTEASFNDDSNEETVNINKVCQGLEEVNGIQILFKHYLSKSKKRCYEKYCRSLLLRNVLFVKYPTR